jgi:hypothetical protein
MGLRLRRPTFGRFWPLRRLERTDDGYLGVMIDHGRVTVPYPKNLKFDFVKCIFLYLELERLSACTVIMMGVSEVHTLML